jgi:HAD superfamily hydrolase (TIGR01509 family)
MVHIKTVIFDLDGVLVDAREIHYNALNNALAKHGFTITREEHLSTFDGLPTRKKLQLLTEKKGLTQELYDEIWKGKQEETFKILKQLEPDYRIIDVLQKLENKGYTLIVCSNSIRESTKLMLLKRGFLEHIDFFLSNEEVHHPKPSPEMYLRAMIKLGVKPKECVIVEDSHIGRKAAIDSGGHLCGVENSNDVTFEHIMNTIRDAEGHNNTFEQPVKWQNKKMNIVIPMAGEGKSFKQAGYSFPKPLIDLFGKPTIQLVVENINTEGRFIFIVKKEHYETYNLQYLLNLIAPGCIIIPVEKPTRGAAETVLLAQEHIDNEDPLVIANADQFIEWDSNEFFYAMAADECDGGMVVFKSNHPRWSYARLGDDGFVTEVAEKKPISNLATAGIYYYKHGQDFVSNAQHMIERNKHVNGEFYVCPVYNECIADNKKIRTFHVDKMWGLGTPEEVNFFITQYKPS